MRLPVLAILATLVACAEAQETLRVRVPVRSASEQDISSSRRVEQNRWEWLDRPEDQARVFNPNAASFHPSNRSFGAKSAQSKTFYFKQSYSPKEFQAKSFTGTKNAWMGDFKFSTKEANSRGKFQVPNADRAYTVSDAGTKTARESEKAMNVRALPGGDREYLGPESKRIHKAVDPTKPTGWEGVMKPMTIDEVRELLNKNK